MRNAKVKSSLLPPKYSVCSTIFNNANRVKRALDLLMKAFKNKNFEMIIVDSYSTDGSFEILQEYARRYHNIKVLRKKCSRGLGQQIAFENSRGEIVIFIHMDTWYEPEKLSKLLKAWEKSKYRQLAVLTLSPPIWICPRFVVEETGGWRNYNYGEDIDFATRIFVSGKGIFVPIELGLDEPLGETKVSFLGAGIIDREIRYAKSIPRYFIRKWKNTMDCYTSCDYTLRKRVLRYRCMKETHFIVLFFFACLRILSKVHNLALKRPISHVDENLPNHCWFIYQMIKNMINPAVFGLKPAKKLLPPVWEKELPIVSQFHPEIRKILKLD